MWMGILVGGVVLIVCVLHALVTVANCGRDEDDYWMGW